MRRFHSPALCHSLTRASATKLLSPPHSQPPPPPPPPSMDPHGADIPCIVQALASASMDPNDAAERPCIVQALAASPSKPPAVPAAARDHPTPPPRNSSRATSPRRTRSGGAPEWTAAETLALVATVAAVDDDGWARSVSAFQKWAIVADNLASSGPSSRRRGRAAGDCKRRWEALVAEYGAVRAAGGRYWRMGAAARRKAGLPEEFDAEVYSIMDALIQVEEAFLAGAGGTGGGGGGDGLVGAGGAQVGGDAGDGEEDIAAEEQDSDCSEGEMQVDDGNDDDVETHNEPKKRQTHAWELANRLNENAQHIHMLLNGEADGDAGQNHAHADAFAPDAMETTRQKADELIKSLGGLVRYLNQFTDLIKENGIEDVVGVN